MTERVEMTLVAILTVRRAAIDKFRQFEKHAVQVMAKHGGRIERTIIVSADRTSDVIQEVHVVTFPDEKSFAAYRNDDRLRELAHLREEAVVHTDVLIGEDGPTYGAG